MTEKRKNEKYIPPGPNHRPMWWVASILFSVIASTATKRLLDENPEAAELISSIVGPFIVGMLPYLVFVILQIDWILILQRTGRRVVPKLQVAINFIVIASILSMGGVVGGGFAALFGASSAVLITAIISGFVLWLVALIFLFVKLITSSITTSGPICPECGSQANAEFEFSPYTGHSIERWCTVCSWSESEPCLPGGFPLPEEDEE